VEEAVTEKSPKLVDKGMLTDIYCVGCGEDFEAERFRPGECPHCGLKYYKYDEDCTEDYSDCWDFIYWEEHDVSKS